VQVHPSLAYARAHPGAHIKTECWYILDAAPGSLIYKGVKAGVTRELFEERLRRGDGASILDCLGAVPAVPGDMHNLPSGTVHALGAGVLVAEVQTPSDTTFRIYDWGRTGREMHVQEALECIQFAPARDAVRLAPDARSGRLVSTGFYTVDERRIGPSDRETPGDGARCIVCIVIEGSCRIEPTANEFDPVNAALGATVLIPAACAARASISGAGAKILRIELM
jgi:mannose-6-phosphate isomerase